MAPAIYATIIQVRPLLGNLRSQLTDTQIQLAIDAATAEVNMRIGRASNDNVEDTDANLEILRKATRYLASEEVLSGIEDMRDDRRDNIRRANELLDKLVSMSITGENDIVSSSSYVTFPAKEINGLLYSSKLKNLKDSKTLAKRFVPLGSMD